MTKEEKISIIITTYNKAKFIKKTLYSCLIQDYKNYEIIVVDTGSTDKTVKIIKSLKKKRIKKIFLKRKFKTSPLNQIYAISCGLKASKGKIICLLDGDDIFKKHNLDPKNVEWLHQDVRRYKKTKNIFPALDSEYDFILFDGGEFSTFAEFKKLYKRTKYFGLDDVETYKQYEVLKFINTHIEKFELINSVKGLSIYKTHN